MVNFTLYLLIVQIFSYFVHIMCNLCSAFSKARNAHSNYFQTLFRQATQVQIFGYLNSNFIQILFSICSSSNFVYYLLKWESIIYEPNGDSLFVQTLFKFIFCSNIVQIQKLFSFCSSSNFVHYLLNVEGIIYIIITYVRIFDNMAVILLGRPPKAWDCQMRASQILNHIATKKEPLGKAGPLPAAPSSTASIPNPETQISSHKGSQI